MQKDHEKKLYKFYQKNKRMPSFREIGQIAGLVYDVPTVADLVLRLRHEYDESVAGLAPLGGDSSG